MAAKLFRDRSTSFWALSQPPLASYSLSIFRGHLFLRLWTLFSSMSSPSPSLLPPLLQDEAPSTKLSLSPYACPRNPPAFNYLALLSSTCFLWSLCAMKGFGTTIIPPPPPKVVLCEQRGADVKFLSRGQCCWECWVCRWSGRRAGVRTGYECVRWLEESRGWKGGLGTNLGLEEACGWWERLSCCCCF